MTNFYILEGKTPVKIDDLLTWAKSIEKADRQLAHTWIRGVRVSTIFLGLNHRFGDGPPLLFETMIFGGWHSHRCWRAETFDDALVMHAIAVGEVEQLSYFHEPAQRYARKVFRWINLKWYRLKNRLYELMP